MSNPSKRDLLKAYGRAEQRWVKAKLAERKAFDNLQFETAKIRAFNKSTERKKQR